MIPKSNTVGNTPCIPVEDLFTHYPGSGINISKYVGTKREVFRGYLSFGNQRPYTRCTHGQSTFPVISLYDDMYNSKRAFGRTSKHLT